MPVSSNEQQWNLRLPQGSSPQWLFTFTLPVPGGTTPYPITGSAWEYVVRNPADDTSGTPLVKITQTPGTSGDITVTASSSLSQVLLTFYGAATSGLAPGSYAHALWMNPAGSQPYAWLSGTLLIVYAPQP